MSLSCLLCERDGRPDIDRELGKPRSSCRCCGIDRSWSGNLSPPPYTNIRRTGSIQPARHHKGNRNKLPNSPSTLSKQYMEQPLTPSASGEPRLLRSGGMRRDWSFEDLGNQRNSLKR